MRALIQRVSRAEVVVEGDSIGKIAKGFLILLGVGDDDTEEDRDYLLGKIQGLRVFSDDTGKMNLNLDQVNGDCLVVSQFTLMASTKKGNRPSYIKAARPEVAEKVYDEFCELLQNRIHGKVEKGRFGANMQVDLLNDGPVTIWIDSKHRE